MTLAINKVNNKFGPAEAESLSSRLERWSAEEILRWAGEQFSPDLALACSFGGPTELVLVDMAVHLRVTVEVFYLDTGILFPETYALRDRIAQRYGIEPVAYLPRLSLDEQARQHGEALWRRDPDSCCHIRKVEPMERALAGKRAWITGLRRDQSPTRRNTPIVAWDDIFGLVKINPLAAWTEAQVWDYVREHSIPYNALHDQGHPSLGCVPCTRPVLPGEDPRAGRWSGFGKTECGLHQRTPASAAPSRTSER